MTVCGSKCFVALMLSGVGLVGCQSVDSSPSATKSDAGAAPCLCTLVENGAMANVACGTEACLGLTNFRCLSAERAIAFGTCGAFGEPGADAAVILMDSGSPPIDSIDAGRRADAGLPNQEDAGINEFPTWEVLPTKTTATLRGVAVGSQSAAYVVGDNGTCFELQFNMLTACRIADAGAVQFAAVATGKADGIVAVASGGETFVRRRGRNVAWTPLEKGTGSVLTAAAVGASAGLVFGPSGRSEFFDLTSSLPVALQPIPEFPQSLSTRAAALFVDSRAGNREDLYLVGESGQIFHGIQRPGDPGSVRFENSGTTKNLNAVAVFRVLVPNSVHAIAVGDEGTILTRDEGGQWKPERTGVQVNLYGVFGGVAGVYAVGERGTILFQNAPGEPWIQQPSGTTKTLRAGAFTQAEFGAGAVIVGDNGTLLTN